MKKNIDFYQHYVTSDQHPKFKMLRVQFGWAGEGKFWALNNRIAQAENCCLNVSKKYNKAAIASDLDFNLKEFDEFITCLLEDCELVRECEPGVITTDIVQENFQRVMVNREKARERKQRSLEKVSKGSGELSKGSGEQNNKVKESKVKEKKTCPEPPNGSRPEDAVFEIPLIAKDGLFFVTNPDLDQWQETFPGIDVKYHLGVIRQWNIDNPTRRKTKSGIRRHISSWLAKEQNKAPKNITRLHQSPPPIQQKTPKEQVRSFFE